ncbi:MAG: phosphoribosylformylglycinamidine synthase subunit PurQ [Acidobacteriota bacterium]
MKIGVVVFPGSNCDHDVYHVLKHQMGLKTEFIWHRTSSLSGYDGLILPGGFSYGDYLRSGAMAAQSPVMGSVRRMAARGVPVLGTCNGFQVLCEAGLLPGALLRNRGIRFVCRDVALRVENHSTPFTSFYEPGQEVCFPVAHFDGNYYCPPEELDRLREGHQVAFRYLSNPNGSLGDIAGIVNSEGNVMGLMPHPERACDTLLGGNDGLALFQALARHLTAR